jgi:nucleoid-associated protein Lsr2
MMDEIDGSQADETVRFGIDGEAFALRSKAPAEELRRSLEPYVKTARKTGSKRNGRRFGSAAIDKDQARAIRGWAKQHGMKVLDSGRV